MAKKIDKSRSALLTEIASLKKANRELQKKLLEIQKAKEKWKTKDIDKNLKTIFDNACVGAAVVDLNGTPVASNKFLQKMLKYSGKELQKITFKEITHPDDFDADYKLFKKLITKKIPFYTLEKRYICKDNRIVWGKLTASMIYDDEKKPKYILSLVEDITHKKETEKKLSFEQALMKALMDLLPDSIYFKDIESKFIRVNKAKALRDGFKSEDELIGKTDSDIFRKEHVEEAINDEKEIIRTGKPILNKEEKIERLDGKVSWVSTTKMPLYDSKHKIIGTFGITRDITEKKLTEDLLKESEERYHTLFDKSADGIFIMTDKFIDCNQTVLEMFNCKREDIIGHHPAEFSPEIQPDGENSFSKAQRLINTALSGKTQNFYWKHKRKDGQLFDAEVTLNSLIINKKTFLQATVRDITKTVRASNIQNALYQISEAASIAENMDRLYQKIHNVIKGLMPAENFYIAIYDEKEELLKFPYFVDQFDPPQAPKKLGKGLTEYVLRKGEAALIDEEKDMELRRLGEVELIGAPQAIWLGIPLVLQNKTIGVMVVQDYENKFAYGEEEKQILIFVSNQIAQAISRRQSVEEIKRYTEELKNLNATKDKFFSIIAHDLKNPFITILGFAELLLADFEELTDEEKKYYVEEMKKSAEISHALLQNLLQWSRTQTGRIEYNPQKISLNQIVEQNFSLLKLTAAKKNIALESSIGSDIILSADEDMTDTVIRNLLTNAVKFTSSGGKVSVKAAKINGFVEIRICDTGVGIDEETKSRLFKLDSAISTAGTSNEKGTGLGLIICKEFIEKHGGKIWVESEAGNGSTFIFTLPSA